MSIDPVTLLAILAFLAIEAIVVGVIAALHLRWRR